MTDPGPSEQSLWSITAPALTTKEAPIETLKGSIDTDSVIIGAGFTGLSAALHLTKCGRDVVIVEANHVGSGASGLNNGQVIPTLTSAEPDQWVARYGETGRRFAQMVGASASALFDTIRQENIDAQAEQTGWFQPAHSPGRTHLSKKRIDAWQRYGLDMYYLDRAATTELLGSDDWYGGMLAPSGGHINPLALARGLAGSVMRYGGKIYEKSRVDTFEHDGVKWLVKTPHGTVTARALILATNAYTSELSPGLAPEYAKSIVPVTSWQMATEPLSKIQQATLLRGRQAVSDTRGDLRFFHYDADHRLITGGAVIGNWNAKQRVAKKAANMLFKSFPQFDAPPKMTHVWQGFLSMNADRFPRIHKLGPNGWTWMGCNGRGVALGNALGREMARAIDGEDPKGLALPVTDPEAIVFHASVRRFAPFYLAWMKMKDVREYKI